MWLIGRIVFIFLFLLSFVIMDASKSGSSIMHNYMTGMDYDIDHTLSSPLKEVQLVRNTEMKGGWESREGGLGRAEFRLKAQKKGDVGRRGCLGNHPPLPVSSCEGAHQRPCAFCLSTRLWMKELARAQFQLFIACKPERWREREGGWGGSVFVCGWVH